jgi:hypothetical protein
MAKVFTITVPPDLSRKKRVRTEDPRYVDGQKMLVEAMKYLAKACGQSRSDRIAFRTRPHSFPHDRLAFKLKIPPEI